jgi:hypothetical protein
VQEPPVVLAKSSPVTPPVKTEIPPNVPAALTVTVTGIEALVVPTLTDPKMVPGELTVAIVKLCVTVKAGPYTTPSPAWVAWIVQIPGARREAAEPETEQIVGVVEAKLTGRPELAVAERGSAIDEFRVWFAIDANVMLWVARPTVKFCVTGVAAAN